MSNEENPIDVKALAAVGSERLATLLAEVAMTNRCMRRRLQFELCTHKGETRSPPFVNGSANLASKRRS